jgi:hypothetical protein
VNIGDKIRITFHGHPEELATAGTVTAVLPDGVVKATIDDVQHPLWNHEGKPRGELTIAPGNYETV